MTVSQRNTRCWVLGTGAVREEEDLPHYSTEAKALSGGGACVGRRQVTCLPAPCFSVSCNGACAGKLEDSERGHTPHATSRSEAEQWATEAGWVIVRDGSTWCPDDAPDLRPWEQAVVGQVPGQLTFDAGVLTAVGWMAAIEAVDAHLDANTAAAYWEQPLAGHWGRVTKVCEEAGEVWKALSRWTGENPRKGVCGTKAELLEELGDTAMAAMCAIQHLTKDAHLTELILDAAVAKALGRISEGSAV